MHFQEHDRYIAEATWEMALVIAAMMTVGTASIAMAATVEVKTSDDYVSTRTFKAYEVLDADWEGGSLTNIKAGKGITWSAEAIAALNAIDGISGITTGADLATALDGKDVTLAEKVAKALIPYTVAAKAFTVTNGGTLPDGYYIIIDETELGKNDVANAALLQVAGDKVTVNVKTDKPSIEKKIDGDTDADTATEGLVDANNGQVNDEVPYVITSTVPDTSYYDHYYMEFNDTLSDGLDYVDGSAKIYAGSTEMDSSKYTLTVDGRSIKLAFHDVKDLDGTVLKLTYKAKINKDAVVGTTGNPNEVTLKYTNSPDHSGSGEYDQDDYTSETPKDVVITYLTGIKILKIDAKTKAHLEGAEFQIVGTRTVSTVVSGVNFEEATNGTYYKLATGAYTTTAPTDDTRARYDGDAIDKTFNKVTVDKEVKTETTDVKISAISGSDGVITFNDLGAGTYTITELLAPTGYNALTEPVTVVIGFTAPTTVAEGNEACTWEKTGASASDENVVFDATEGLFKVTIGNNSGSTLPSTGGIGTTIFYVIGAILVLGAGILLVSKRRMAE